MKNNPRSIHPLDQWISQIKQGQKQFSVLVDPEKRLNRALAAYHMGAKAIYLEAGSSAHNPVPAEIIRRVKRATALPLIVDGGLRELDQINKAWSAGADMVVVGTAIEEVLSLTQ